MNGFTVFAIQTTVTLVVYVILAKWYVWPRLSRLPLRSALIALLWIHTLRTLGLTNLVPSISDPALPREFAEPVAYGDLIAVALAFLAILALRFNWSGAIPLVWVFNIVGTLDIVNAFVQGFAYDVTRYDLGIAWYIPTFFVPALWVTHAMVFIALLRGSAAPAPARAAAQP